RSSDFKLCCSRACCSARSTLLINSSIVIPLYIAVYLRFSRVLIPGQGRVFREVLKFSPKIEVGGAYPGNLSASLCLREAKIFVLSAARSFALRDRGLRSISSWPAVTGFFVSTL